MWQSQTNFSLNIIQTFLEIYCIAPSHRQFFQTFYFWFLIAFEALFNVTIYLKFFYYGGFLEHMTDTVRTSLRIVFFLQGRLYCFGVLLSACSRSAQQTLFDQMKILDSRLWSHLHIEPSFRRFNIEFVALTIVVTSYFCGYFFYLAMRSRSDVLIILYCFCCLFADHFFTIYLLYMVYWARVFLNRSEYVIEALRVLFMAEYVSKNSMTAIMELLKLLFDVRESIQDAFGSMLSVIIFLNSIQIAVTLYAFIHNMARYNIFNENYNIYGTIITMFYLIWCLLYSMRLAYVIVFFSKIGDVVSYCITDRDSTSIN